MDNDILYNAMRRAKMLGADQIDILAVEDNAISVSTRLANLENVTRSETISIKMRTSLGKRSAVVITNNVDELKKESFVQKAVFAAKNAPEETTEFRPNPNELCKNFAKIDVCDTQTVSSQDLIDAALECESTALQINGITNSEGAKASHSRSKIILMKNDDFFAEYDRTFNQLSVVTLAEKDGFLEQDYDFSETVYWSDLKNPQLIAKESAERTLRRLGARKIQSCKVPVIFDRRVSSQLLGDFVAAISGGSVANGISFLKDKLSQKIFSDEVSIVDKYSTARGLRSRPFDSDGLECSDTIVVQSGVLQSFILNMKYANKLRMKSTGNALGFDGVAPNNICIENGTRSFQDLLKSVKNGLYVVEALGNGLNIVTGNYSQGAVGFWIENGEIAYPVNEVTIAGNFIEMLSNCKVANDLKINSGIDAPSLLLNEIVVGGV
ncbi:MAG: TldD/PmbA family protein [Holosporaceae bacterium]|nr:TldD/PmbA family protein [Holosporaceae bacterium]